MPFPGRPIVPKYRLHKPSGLAVVRLSGQDFYLGRHGSAESREEYERLVAEWLANGRQLQSETQSAAPGADLTINELILAYWKHAQTYYLKNGRPTKEQANILLAMAPLQEHYGRAAAKSFGPLALKNVRQSLIDAKHSRSYINGQIGRIKRIYKWAVENELVPPTVYQGLQAVAGLRRGRSAARESEPVRPVPDALVDAIRPFVSRPVRAMVELQRLTGMRPGEVVALRGCDLDMNGRIWAYTPAEHKTEHHGRERTIYLGPRAQRIVEPFLKADTTSPLFSPQDAERERHAKAAVHRRFDQKPNLRKTERRVRDRYDVDSYRRAIERGCDAAFPPPPPLARQEGEHLAAWQRRLTMDQKEELHRWRSEHRWHPHQLRHNAATFLRKEYGIEAARVVLGHSSAAVTELYAEVDRAKAAQIMSEVG